MRKVLNTLAALVLLTSISLPLASFADEVESETESTSTEGSHSEHDEMDERHHEIEQIYENFEGVVIPPVVMRLGEQINPDMYILPILPVKEIEKSLTPGSSNLITQQIEIPGFEQRNRLDPNKLAPLPVDDLVLTTETPTDEFVDGAKQWGIALVVVAIVLLGFAGISSYRTGKRKSSNL
jgi:hypothetical protein